MTIGAGTRISEGMRIVGSIEGSGDLVIEGRVEGSLSLGGALHLGAAAFVEGAIRVQSAVIGGKVVGDVEATESIELLAGCRVEGDLRAPRLTLAEGAILRGRVELGDEAQIPSGDETVGSTRAPADEGDGRRGIEGGWTSVGAATDEARRRVAEPRPEGDGPPPMPRSALALGARRKVIVRGGSI